MKEYLFAILFVFLACRTATATGALTLKINDKIIPVNWENNESVYELRRLAQKKPLTIKMSPYGGFEQVGSIGTSITRDDVQTTTQVGDIVLYSGNQIVIFYDSNTWAYTRLGKISEMSGQKLKELLQGNNVIVTLSVN